MTSQTPGLTDRLLGGAWQRLKEFSAIGGNASYCWPAWIVLRAVGLVYILIFGGLIAEAVALVGPNGILPAQEFMAALLKQYPNQLEAFLRAPSLLWLGSSAAMISAVAWLGLLAAVAVVLNLWPRLAMIVAWLCFVSFATMGDFFSVTAPDPLMLEMGFLCIFLAPPGRLPGWFATTPPRRIAVLALRLMLLRLMLEAGLSKFVFGNALWNNLSVMDVMYETSPFPTFLGYWDFHLPHFHHVMEIGITFAAEFGAPFLIVLGNRRWRWIGFWVWSLFQAGIELTNNFGWLNVAAIALAVIALDDAMLIDAARGLRLRKLGELLATQLRRVVPPVLSPWSRWSLRAVLGVQFAVSMFFYLVAPVRIPIEAVPALIKEPVVLLFASWRSANGYPLFGNIMAVREVVEFSGSNDGGETWRTYPYRYLAHRPDQISPFIAPWYPRFEATLQTTMLITKSPVLYQKVAEQLLRGNRDVTRLFRYDPFSDRPPTLVRLSTYRLRFTDYKTYRATGDYWTKDYEGEFAPVMSLNDHGEVVIHE